MHKEVINTLLYFDIFDYPLTKAEIQKYISIDCTESEVEKVLDSLMNEEKVFRFNNFFSVHNKESHSNNRLSTNKLAKSSMPKAIKIAHLIQKFPFVLSVNLSGSISKNVMHPDSDIDFFVITESNRLWLGKLFLVLYKRFFLINRKRNFCINYFISESKLQIQEENIFTAVELTSMIPVTGRHWHGKLLEANPWIKNYCKNFKFRKVEPKSKTKKPLWSKFLTSILRSSLGNRLEKNIMERVNQKNKKKYSKGLNEKEFELMFRSNKEQAKVHNSNHQQKILSLYADKIKNFESRYNTTISEKN